MFCNQHLQKVVPVCPDFSLIEFCWQKEHQQNVLKFTLIDETASIALLSSDEVKASYWVDTNTKPSTCDIKYEGQGVYSMAMPKSGFVGVHILFNGEITHVVNTILEKKEN